MLIANNNKSVWIKAGYEIFAAAGQTSLKVEPLAKSINKSKSSFYHYFADMEVFSTMLLEHHLTQCYLMADRERKATSIDPELINILIQHKTDLLFNRQLRINQNVRSFAETLSQSNKIVGDAFIQVWIKELNINLTRKQVDDIFSLALENFFLQINPDNINYMWLSQYFKNLKQTANSFA